MSYHDLQVAQILNGTGSGTPYLNQIIQTGASRITSIVSDQNSNMLIAHFDGTFKSIKDSLGSTASAAALQGISLLSGLASQPSFGCEYNTLLHLSSSTCRHLKSRPNELQSGQRLPWNPPLAAYSQLQASNLHVRAALGDSSGYITAPIIGTGTFTYLHDTAVKGALAF